MSVSTLLAMPRAEGLFHRAIAQSGAAHHVMSVASAERIRDILARKLGVEATCEAFAAVPGDLGVAAQGGLKGQLVSHPGPERWGAGGVTTLLPGRPVGGRGYIPPPPPARQFG